MDAVDEPPGGHYGTEGIAVSGDSVFNYPGNKAQYADRIVDTFADHRVYVEVFGGAAGVLANKPLSHNEIYNDVDGDLVQFFDVLRERCDDLVDFLEDVPYAREKYEKWSNRWYDHGWRPDDPVKRAAVFYFLRQTSFGGKYRYKGGFATSHKRNQARTYTNGLTRLREFADRFAEVVIENLDWVECIDRYDGPETLFYCDPPYRETAHRYRSGNGFDHDEFGATLGQITGDWVVSYDSIPERVETAASTVSHDDVISPMGIGINQGDGATRQESLALSFDPDSEDLFPEKQTGLGRWSE